MQLFLDRKRNNYLLLPRLIAIKLLVGMITIYVNHSVSELVNGKAGLYLPLQGWLIWMYKLALCDGKASYFFKLHPSYSETSAGAFTSLLCCMHKFNMFCSTKAKKNS